MILAVQQSFPDLQDVRLVSGLQRHGYDAGVDLGLCVFTLVRDIQNVRAGLRNAGEQLREIAKPMEKNAYGQYLLQLAKD